MDEYERLMMAIETPDFITTGDIVTYRGDTFKVLKVNPANYRVLGEDGMTYNLRRHPSVKKAPEGTVFAAALPEVKEGMAVRFKNPGTRFTGVYICTSASGGQGKFVKLGGGGRVNGPLSGVELVDEINKVDWK